MTDAARHHRPRRWIERLGAALAASLLAAALTTLAPTRAQGQLPLPPLVERQIVSTGQNRTYKVHLPSQYAANPAARFPVILAFHGGGGQAEDIARHWTQWANRGLILVFPNASPLGPSPRTWRAIGDTAIDPTVNPMLDEQFVLDILADMRANLRVDTSRIYACGFSSGAKLTHQLAMNLSHLIRGFGMCSRGLPRGLAPYVPRVLRPMCYFVGTRDTDHVNGDVVALPAEETRDWWVRALGGDPARYWETRVTRAGPTDTLVRRYKPPIGAAIHAYRVIGGDHRWFRFPLDDIETSDQLIAFWRQFAGL